MDLHAQYFSKTNHPKEILDAKAEFYAGKMANRKRHELFLRDQKVNNGIN